MTTTPFISVVIPVLNAALYLPKCLASLAAQEYPKELYEVILADSGSTDTTRSIAASYGASVVGVSGMSVCAGRNAGFLASRGDIVAFSDADCVMDSRWLANAVRYFNEDETIACVGGPSLIPGDETPFGRAAGFVFSFPLFTGGSTYGLQLEEVREVRHNPGCNAIYRRSALQKVMPVDEKFVEGEDVMMNKRLVDLGYRFLFTPDTKLWHYRSSTPKRFWRQNYKYAIGRVLMARADRSLINGLHIAAGLGIPVLACLGVLALTVNGAILVLPLFAAAAGLAAFAGLAFIRTRSFAVAVRVPVAAAMLFTAWSLGFMRECVR